jgi:hypothetical protein
MRRRSQSLIENWVREVSLHSLPLAINRHHDERDAITADNPLFCYSGA